mmetsp:Transcript_15652/g.33896  ORF Transcript_15652/g.33896 Transcript_15652/m.33896 type:complete len:595 (+) Transcript_15652:20-1804(+)
MAPPRSPHHFALLFRIVVLAFCLCDAFAKLFEAKSKKVIRLTAELAALEAERLSKLVVVFGYEFDKLGFFTSVSISTVIFVALIIQLGRSRKRWKKLALSGAATGKPTATSTTTATARRNTIMLILGAAIFFYYLTFNLGKASESKKNKYTRSSSRKGGLDPQRLSGLVILFGKYELDKATFYVLVSTSMVLLVALGAQIGIWCRQRRDSQFEKDRDAVGRVAVSPNDTSLDVVIVGCGPQSVGWFHLMQFLDMPNINVRAVVEPFYLDKTKCPYPPQSFVDLVMLLDEMGTKCVYHVGQLDIFKQKTLCIIAGRTRDNPRLFRECIGMGASHIYLESPGAPTIEQLKDMQSLAATRSVKVYMGYQRLCSSYIEKAILLSRSIPKSHVFFCHNETYRSKELHLAVGRHPEGMIRSMAAQELAVLVTQLGVKVNEIAAFKVNTNRLFSEKQTFYNKSNGNKVTDFSRVAFKITTKKRRSASIMADRCGGLVSFAVVKSHTGKELQRFQSHDEDQVSVVQDELREDKEIMQQFIIESEEYLELKKRVVKSILSGDASKSSGLVSIQNGIDVMALADYCTIEINDVLKAEDYSEDGW